MGISLCFDLGNTRAKCGVYSGNILIREEDLERGNLLRDAGRCLDSCQAERIILCSVTEHPKALEELLASRAPLILLDQYTPLPLRNLYESPQSLGADRLALACGGQARFPGVHVLVIAAGTCLTYNFVHREGSFLGGGISPGLSMRFQALAHFTHGLPLIQASWDYPLIGYNTRQSLLSGVQGGILEEVKGMVRLYQEKYSGLRVLISGGDSGFFEGRIRDGIQILPSLAFEGLYSILEYTSGAGGAPGLGREASTS